MNARSVKWLVYLLPIGAAILIDQVTKAYALAHLAYQQKIPVLPSFNLTLNFNYGAAFGMLNHPEISRWILIGLTGVISIVLMVCMRRERNPVSRVAYGMIVGGALGNIVDRLRHGRVTDFLDFYVGTYHWPTFNMADVSIFCGVVTLLWMGYRSSQSIPKNAV